jgi:hypothetical protein
MSFQTSQTFSAKTPSTKTPYPRPNVPNPNHTVVAIARHGHRNRDFGVGYGNSSGYASGRRYASDWGNARFHCG